MAYHFIDNVYSKILTPREPNVELLDASCERNIIVCLGNITGKTFIAGKLTEHVITKASGTEGTLSLYLADSPGIVSCQAACFQRLTDMTVGEYHGAEEFPKWTTSPSKKSREDKILVMETQVAVVLLQKRVLKMPEINLIILHGCQSVLQDGSVPMKEVMKFYFESHKKPHILSLSSSLFSSGLDLSQMESSLIKMEDVLDCKVETASSVTSTLRYGTHPHEVVLECSSHRPTSIDQIIEEEIMRAIDFIRDHRYDPTEIYEGFMDELLSIPDPKCEPEEVLLELLNILHTMGPWSADRAALVLLLQIEKLKVTTPYERHFLLLCMASSVLVKIRAIFDNFFQDIEEKERIYKYSSPKVLRVFEILKKFQPEKGESDVEDLSEEENEEESKGELEEEETKKDPESNPSPAVAESESKSCECEVITDYLVRRMRTPGLQDVTYRQFVDIVKNKKRSSRNLADKVTESDNENSINDKIDNRTVTEVAANSEETKVLQTKNGYLPVTKGNILNLGTSEERKLNEANTLENYLQYHEYLLLPRFKVERHPRWDRFGVPNQGRGSSGEEFLFRQMKSFGDGDFQFCGLIFVNKKITAQVLFHVLNDLKQADEDFSFLTVHFTVEKVVDASKDPKGAENEHRKQELMLKKFRMRMCNLLIGTSFLEEGIDLPKCNLVIRFDLPRDYRSYINTKERARAADALYCLLVDSPQREEFVSQLGKYYVTDEMLLRKCGNLEPPEEEERDADQYSSLIQPFCPLGREGCAHVDLSTAVALVNRYCAKLPSDTFTRLTPIWNVRSVEAFGRKMFVCSIRLPINSPVKQEIQGCPMPTVVLSRRFAAFHCCQILHRSGELDDTLQPISKESFWMREEEQLTSTLKELEEMIPKDSLEPRPGTTKRRQYYYKKIADSLTDCLPVVGKPSFLYNISMELTCPLPEEQNTRGRKIHPPEDSSQGFGILTRKSIPRIGAFPIFTRSGEVQVKLRLAQSTVVLSELQVDKIVAFIHYTFTSVLRLQKYLMMFDPNSSENSYFIVPTKKGKNPDNVEVDWDFLELIFEKRNQVPAFIPDEARKKFVFDPKKFEDAVVSPWYRNQDQPQYLYVAEICSNLNPTSAFPGVEYKSFEEYYFKKYGIQIQNRTQALLDVDHTSARLNFLTPRYVNRKGVALPTTSEEKKRARRENLKQKQILIPELCDIHPFPATLWRKAVCLPCILHRVNALLLADQVRRTVAAEIGVGITDLGPEFDWEPLNFGWSLADVLKQTKTLKQADPEPEKKTKEERKQPETPKVEETTKAEERGPEENGPWLEIGTWSNDMAISRFEEEDIPLPKNITMIEKHNDINGWDSEISTNGSDFVRYCSPTNWLNEARVDENNTAGYSSESSYSGDDYVEEEDSTTDADSDCGFKIEFKEDNVAEAVEENCKVTTQLKDLNVVEEEEPWHHEEANGYSRHVKEFNENVEKRKEEILTGGRFFEGEKPFDFDRPRRNVKNGEKAATGPGDAGESSPFGNRDNLFPRTAEEIPEEVKKLPHTDLILRTLKDEEEREKERRRRSREENGRESQEWLRPALAFEELEDICKDFSFDEQPDLNGHPGPSPSLILQALTMSNANDGINLERLETIGDSFLKYAITTYLYCVYDNVHEGKLSHLRSKQVSNFNLYRLGRRKMLGENMIATKFEPHDNWLPPCYYVPRELERALIEAGVPASHWNRADLPSLRNLSKEEISQLVREKGEKLGICGSEKGSVTATVPCLSLENIPCFIPYNLMTQHSIPDKSIADCVEALIGAYLVACGPRGALLFMSWLGIRVLPREEKFFPVSDDVNVRHGVGCSRPVKVTTEEGEWSQVCFGELQSPQQPLLRHLANPEDELEKLLRGFDAFEDSIKYRFRDRSYLLQALTHASYSLNRLTDCYQRLEFLGDAVLDYLITRHLYEDSRHHSPGALTDLRSALVNNTIFASLAVRHNFHKYFRHLCPSLNEVVDRFVRIQQENGHAITEEFYLMGEDECEEAEDVEVPKALGDVFESVAGAIFLDSGMSLDAVWKVYYRIMKNEIEAFSTNVPKSPIRELFELEPETAQFGKPEKLADGKRVRVSVEVFGKGIFNGIGRNYRIAKCTAAKCALKQLKRKGLLERRK